MTEKEMAEQHRLAQAQAMLDAFERDRGRKAQSTKELEAWVAENPQKAKDAASNPYHQDEDN